MLADVLTTTTIRWFQKCPFDPNLKRITVYAFLLLELYCAIECSITWELATDPVIFGKEVKLSCDGNGCKSSTTRKWIGGEEYKLLCLEGDTRDNPKYEMMLNTASSMFDLMIKDFGLSDINCDYTCACGFQQYTKRLSLDNIKLIYPPTENETTNSVSLRNEKLYIEITIKKIFPLPTCTMFYNHQKMKENVSLQMNMVEVVPNIRYYTVVIKSYFELDQQNCSGNFILDCNVDGVSETYNVFQKSIDHCADLSSDTTYITLAIGGLVVCSCLFTLTVLIIRRKKKKKKKKAIPDTEMKSLRPVDEPKNTSKATFTEMDVALV